jgi:isopentenyl phosphate kinase
MPERVIVKLGGSVITDKSGTCSVDGRRLAEIAEMIAGHPGRELLVVHGAGSCGHPEAHRYRIRDGVDRTNREGVHVTHASVRSLNDAVVAALRARGVEATGIHPLDACLAENGRIVSFADGPLETMLGLGIVPVLHGDVAMDRARGACIVSGDQLVRYLAVALGMKRIGLATDVPGVLAGGGVVPELSRATAASIEIGTSSHTDVTGGMSGKIQELLELADAGIESEIFHVSRLGDFLDGKPHGGTRVRSAEHG